MSCNCDNGPSYYLQCAGLQPVYTEADVTLYTTRVGATGGTKNWVQCYSVACLQAVRLIYWANTPGDCGKSTGVAPTTGQIIGGKLKAIAIADPEPISKAVVGIVATIAGFFGAAHAQAVQNEHQFLCSAMLQYNQFAYAMENAISSGAILVPDAVAQLQAVCSQIRSGLGAVVKPINAAYGMQLAIDALRVFNTEVIYPALKPSGISSLFGGLFNSGTSQQNGATSATSTPADGSVFSSAGGKVFAVGAGFVGAKVLGVL